MNYSEKIFMCPFCGRELKETWSSCCGEAGRGEWVYFDENGNEIDPPKGAA